MAVRLEVRQLALRVLRQLAPQLRLRRPPFLRRPRPLPLQLLTRRLRPKTRANSHDTRQQEAKVLRKRHIYRSLTAHGVTKVSRPQAI